MSITLSHTAADRVRRFLDVRGHGTGLRLAVKKTGCSGFAYVVDLEDEIGEGDRVFESNGIPVIVDPTPCAWSTAPTSTSGAMG